MKKLHAWLALTLSFVLAAALVPSAAFADDGAIGDASGQGQEEPTTIVEAASADESASASASAVNATAGATDSTPDGQASTPTLGVAEASAPTLGPAVAGANFTVTSEGDDKGIAIVTTERDGETTHWYDDAEMGGATDRVEGTAVPSSTLNVTVAFGLIADSVTINNEPFDFDDPTHFSLPLASAGDYNIHLVAKVDPLQTTLIWSTAKKPVPDKDHFVVNGDVDVLSVTYEGVTYSREDLYKNGEEDGPDGFTSGRPSGSKGSDPDDPDSISFYYFRIPAGATVTIKLKPEYGYQYLKGALNGQAEITPQQEMGTFTFVMPRCNLHLAALFTQVDDSVVNNDANIASGTVKGNGNIIDSGNLRLEIQEMGAADRATMDQSSAANGGTGVLYLDLSLDQLVAKGNANSAWTSSLSELNDSAQMSFVLSDEAAAKIPDGATVFVVRNHNGVTERIPATYDAATKTLTFSSDRFSDYAVYFEEGKATPPAPSFKMAAATAPTTSAPGSERSPQTGDLSTNVAPIVLLAVGLLAVGLFGKARARV
ncbi:hypothetical protein [Parafannyhessea umbonata]|uniref:Gram-positive cocci surface proteins LPxTG domain-containing protein n=1 Tax=Parafannyhessea umbonata TaxID=604330 RepID=A0A1H9Q4R6_9ACTN|nr:hypothetical protein [Parafannyhessea umbonata]SER54919.1 hypothetical protein SAMN05216446_1281 [Parafannyhessea umbonata]